MAQVGRSRPSPEKLAGSGVLALVDVPTADALLSDLAARFDQGTGFAVATLNLDHIVKLRRDARFRRAYAAQTHVVADGNPIVWLSHLAGQRDVRLVPGSELVRPMVALAARKGVTVALFGSTELVLKEAAARLEADHPGLKVVSCIAPPMGFDPESPAADALIDQVAASGAGLCLLALGAPKQEVLAARSFARHPQLGFLSIGAGLDFIVGHQTRAPLWVRRIAMEWLWRMLSNPKRLAKRYFDCGVVLPGLALAAWKMGRRDV